MRNQPRIFRIIVATVALAALVVGSVRSAAADSSPLELLARAARVECDSTAAWANQSCRLAHAAEECREGDADACELAGRVNMTRSVHDVPRATVSKFFLQRSCQLAPTRCAALVPVVMRDDAGVAFARVLLETGCAHSRDVCVIAASMYLAGREVPEDVPLARSFLHRACVRGDAQACRRHGAL